jgi:hypothetical protein
MRMYRESTPALDREDLDDEISGVHTVSSGMTTDGTHPAILLEEVCADRGHPQSSLADECLCGLTRYD